MCNGEKYFPRGVESTPVTEDSKVRLQFSVSRLLYTLNQLQYKTK